MRYSTIRLLATLLIAPLTLWFVPAPAALAQEDTPTPRQIVALDECDPTTFNAVLGPGFCKNVALAFVTPFATKFADLFAKAAAGVPDPNWDFEPDKVTIKKGTPLIVVNQGGEPHPFTQVAKFGGGFVAGLNGGQAPVPECAGGFKDLAVARTRILQGSQLQVAGLSKGEHLFQCCIHPGMRVTVDVKTRDSDGE
jgi:plastocyanin